MGRRLRPQHRYSRYPMNETQNHSRNSLEIAGNVVDVLAARIYFARLVVRDGRIREFHDIGEPRAGERYLLPGFIDAHVHIESSMLVPTEFARLAVRHGTVATVSDPHEIGNVLGVEGVEYMIRNASGSPLKFNFGAPSCVPAPRFETAGAEINAADVGTLLARPDIRFLSEVMNFPGVIHGDADMLEKIRHAKAAGKVIDGHAPGLRGTDCEKYFAAGVSTDHECYT